MIRIFPFIVLFHDLGFIPDLCQSESAHLI
jgi:hypothetical protein